MGNGDGTDLSMNIYLLDSQQDACSTKFVDNTNCKVKRKIIIKINWKNFKLK